MFSEHENAQCAHEVDIKFKHETEVTHTFYFSAGDCYFDTTALSDALNEGCFKKNLSGSFTAFMVNGVHLVVYTSLTVNEDDSMLVDQHILQCVHVMLVEGNYISIN